MKIINISRYRVPLTICQRGIALLEVLIALLLFSIGILGVVSLQVQAYRFNNDTQYRTQAMHLSNAYIGKMWAASMGVYNDVFMAASGTEYQRFKNAVTGNDGLPGAAEIADNPQITVNAGPTSGSREVQVSIHWKPPGSPRTHQFTQTSVIGY